MSGGSTVFTTRLALVEFSFDRNRNKTSIRFVRRFRGSLAQRSASSGGVWRLDSRFLG